MMTFALPALIRGPRIVLLVAMLLLALVAIIEAPRALPVLATGLAFSA